MKVTFQTNIGSNLRSKRRLTEKNENEEEGSRDNLGRFLQISRRDGKTKSPENLILMKLFQAQSSDKLTRVQKIVEAGWDGKELWKEKLNVDLDLLDVLYAVASDLKDTTPEKIVEQHQKFPHNYYYYFRYCIAWAFPRSMPNFDKYIEPWLTKTPVHYVNKIMNPEDSRVYTTRFLCPYCKEELLVLKHEGNSTRKTVSDFISSYKKTLIQKFEYVIDFRYTRYPRPTKATIQYIKCPKCKEEIILTEKREKGSNEPDPEKIAHWEKHLEKFKWITREETNTLPREMEVAYFWDVCTVLNKQGFQQLKNMFLRWANPQVSKLEIQIAQHINPTLWNEFFKDHKPNGEKESSEQSD
jgi:uncharacterized protein YbaR (Trm112 family)